MTTSTLERTETPTALRIADRCDQSACGSQAFVRVAIPVQDKPLVLDFCGHHFRKNEAALLRQGATIVEDGRARINAAPSPSANAH